MVGRGGGVRGSECMLQIAPKETRRNDACAKFAICSFFLGGQVALALALGELS